MLHICLVLFCYCKLQLYWWPICPGSPSSSSTSRDPTLLHRPLDNSAWAWQLSPRLLVLSNSKSFQKWSKKIIKIGWSIHWWNMITYDIWSHEASKTTKILLCWTDQKWKCSALYKPFSINLRVAAPAEGLVQQTRLAPVWAKHPLQSLGLQHKATRTCEAPVSPGCGSQANSQELLVGCFNGHYLVNLGNHTIGQAGACELSGVTRSHQKGTPIIPTDAPEIGLVTFMEASR